MIKIGSKVRAKTYNGVPIGTTGIIRVLSPNGGVGVEWDQPLRGGHELNSVGLNPPCRLGCRYWVNRQSLELQGNIQLDLFI